MRWAEVKMTVLHCMNCVGDLREAKHHCPLPSYMPKLSLKQQINWQRSGSPTLSVVMNVRSNARDQSSRIDYWTLNSRNINSMFAVNGWFIQRLVTYMYSLKGLGWLALFGRIQYVTCRKENDIFCGVFIQWTHWRVHTVVTKIMMAATTEFV